MDPEVKEENGKKEAVKQETKKQEKQEERETKRDDEGNEEVKNQDDDEEDHGEARGENDDDDDDELSTDHPRLQLSNDYYVMRLIEALEINEATLLRRVANPEIDDDEQQLAEQLQKTARRRRELQTWLQSEDNGKAEEERDLIIQDVLRSVEIRFLTIFLLLLVDALRWAMSSPSTSLLYSMSSACIHLPFVPRVLPTPLSSSSSFTLVFFTSTWWSPWSSSSSSSSTSSSAISRSLSSSSSTFYSFCHFDTSSSSPSSSSSSLQHLSVSIFSAAFTSFHAFLA